MLDIERAAHQQGVKLGHWEPSKLSCLGTRYPLRERLEEVRVWLEKNPEEFVILYLDTKPFTLSSKEQADAMSALIREVFGQSVWAAAEGLPLNRTVRSLLAAGKRLYLEGHEDKFAAAEDKVVFPQALWSHQFHDEELE